jgi:hypothetical protein
MFKTKLKMGSYYLKVLKDKSESNWESRDCFELSRDAKSEISYLIGLVIPFSPSTSTSFSLYLPHSCSFSLSLSVSLTLSHLIHNKSGFLKKMKQEDIRLNYQTAWGRD